MLSSILPEETETIPTLSEPGSSVLAPWLENPYRLLSWWKMEKFTAGSFYAIGVGLQAIKDEIQHYLDANQWNREMPITKEMLGTVVDDLTVMKERCTSIGLTVSVKCVDGMLEVPDS